jgi:hypothetical protein
VVHPLCLRSGQLTAVWAFHQTIAAWFDQTDYVKRYSPFGVMQNMQGVNDFNRLMSASGSITALGSWVGGLMELT